MLCEVTVPFWLAGPVALGWGIVAIFIVSTLATLAVRAFTNLPPLLSGPILVPAVVWHELCHAIACLIAGHRIEHIRLYSTTRRRAHVSYSYNPRSGWQSIGTALVGWAPVLFSGALLVWGVPRVFNMEPTHQAFGWYGVLVLAMAMPLSGADWRGALGHILLLAGVVALVGLLVAPVAMSACAPMLALLPAVIAASMLLGSIAVVAFLFGFVLRVCSVGTQ